MVHRLICPTTSIVVVHRLSCPHGMWDLPRPGIKPLPLHWKHGFLTSGPRRKWYMCFFNSLNLPIAQMVKNLLAMQETWIRFWVRKILWRRQQQSTPVFLPEESHGQRNLTGYSPWDCKESDMTEQLTVLLQISSFVKRDSNIYYSMLLIPMCIMYWCMTNQLKN